MKTEDLALFNKVIEYQSLSAASRALSIPVSKISRNISQLEQSLGTRLLDRTTRSLTLTEAGVDFLERSSRILAEVEALQLSVGQLQVEPQGEIIIAAPLDFINLTCRRALGQFHQRFPELKLKFISYQSMQSPMDIQADLVLYVSHESPPDSSMVGRKLVTLKRYFVASPDFIEKHPELTHPAQLADYPCLLSAKGGLPSNLWLWRDGEQLHKLEVEGPLEAEMNELCISAAVDGLGIAWVPPVMCREYLQSGELKLLFDGRFATDISTWGLYSCRQFLPHRVRLALDFFQHECAQMEQNQL
ncbi:LysR family transcriptional regulator [Shewanella atlantica]|uniref:LysR family transcriptional regulator n=1 Tax=Shewanella atlantica TaxID=271099 RepID=UPI0037350CD2